jgi:hypothetical protein
MAIALATLCVGAAWGGSARAGEYHVYSCRMPDGSVAPTDGWSGSATGAFVYDEDKCAKNGALIAALGDGVEHTSNTDVATWTFGVPVGETLTGATLWRAGDADGGTAASATYEFWLSGPTETSSFDECVYLSCTNGEGELEEPFAATNQIVVAAGHLGSDLYLNAACYGTLGRPCKKGEHDPNGYAAVVYLYAADLLLEQTSQPAVTGVEGELATASTLSGTADVSFHAEDPGSGVYQAVFTVDGNEVGRTLLSENGGHCRDVGQTTDGLPAFLYLQPCSASLNADVPLDTTALADGSRHLLVTVINAAGDSTVAFDRKITVANHPQVPGLNQLPSEGQGPTVIAKNEQSLQKNPLPQLSPDNGSHATAAARLSVRWGATARASLAGAYGRAQTVLGRLTAPDGSPIGGATLRVFDTPSSQGAPSRPLASLRTASTGSFRLRLPPSIPSSRLTFAYSSNTSQPAPDVTATLQLTVPASLSLSIAPHTTHMGGTIAFTGTLHGTPLPHGGKQLVLEARTHAGPWRQFRVLTTGAHGRYHSTYRFRLPGPITYEFRAVSPHEADFPFATGTSKVVPVRER